MEKRKKSGFVILVVALLFSLLTTSIGLCQEDINYSDSYQKALQLAARLSPEEKVGQLFLITFDGTEITKESEIYQLISEHYVGGVVLKSENVNFPDSKNSLQNINALISGLQTIAQDERNELGDLPNIDFFNDYIPIFIGISQLGGSYPYDQLVNVVTSTPSQMAIGATWNTSAAENTG